MKLSSLGLLGISLVLAPGCGGDDSGPVEMQEQSDAPLCSDLHGANPRELFTQAVIPVDKVQQSLIFGGMDPGTFEPINFELGFLLNDTNVEVRAPVDLYLHSIHSQSYSGGFRDGETDFGMSFDVCADGERIAVVNGDFAHITAIEPEIQAIFDNATLDCQSKTGPEESADECIAYLRDAGIVIEAGTLIGTAGGTGQSDYTPGFDFNLLDSRYPNQFVNPDRIGSEEGPGRAFRYGTCVYEYFPESIRDAYMALVGQNGEHRVSEQYPCGTMSIGMEGTAAGLWIPADLADLDINEDHFDVLGNLLVLGPHPVHPSDQEVISAEISEFNDVDGNCRLMHFQHFGNGDVNVSFYDMVPGPIYCMATEPLGDVGFAYYYLELGFNGATLMLERIDEDCSEVPQEERSFSEAAVEFLR